jgi:hypothetical protein
MMRRPRSTAKRDAALTVYEPVGATYYVGKTRERRDRAAALLAQRQGGGAARVGQLGSR